MFHIAAGRGCSAGSSVRKNLRSKFIRRERKRRHLPKILGGRLRSHHGLHRYHPNKRHAHPHRASLHNSANLCLYEL